jgi:prepilin-type N-terminal cleavage/methylation domain-containing protein
MELYAEAPTSRQHQQPMRGFSMIELMAVVAIMAIVGAMALPAVLSTLRYRKVNTAMLSAGGAIQSARYKSLSKGIPYQITFNSSTGTYTVLACNNCASAIYTPTSTFTYGADTLDPATGVAIPFSSGPGGAALAANQTFYFRPGGAVQWVADGTTSCSSPLYMTFTYQGVSKQLSVECYGKITIPQ